MTKGTVWAMMAGLRPLKAMSEEQLKASHEALASKEPNQDQAAPQEVSQEELQDVAGGKKPTIFAPGSTFLG